VAAVLVLVLALHVLRRAWRHRHQKMQVNRLCRLLEKTRRQAVARLIKVMRTLETAEKQRPDASHATSDSQMGSEAPQNTAVHRKKNAAYRRYLGVVESP